MSIYLGAITEGFLWGIMGLGLYISFRILNFADLTSESSFTLGAAIAVALMSNGVNPFVATIVAVFGGMIAGFITGFLTTVFEIPGLLSSIITMTGLYSMNLRIMGKPNSSFRGTETIFSQLEDFFSSELLLDAVVGVFFVGLIILFLNYFFKTDFGQAIIATGDNAVMAMSLGIKTKSMSRIALMLANGLIALSGALIAQNNGFSDVSMGTGTVVVAMASIVIGEVLIRKELSLSSRLLSIVLGAIIYRLILVFVLRLGLNPNDFKLISALVLAVFLVFPKVSAFFQERRQKTNNGLGGL
ncbi:ABC transporter permease [Aerococcaceae bacterium DSM 111022]|nr:ABC transporter permease [Aerococcaceae bacterium DSM 111022]